MSPASTRTLRIGGSVLLLAAAIVLLPRGELLAALRQAPPRVLALAAVAFVGCHVAAACKWRLLMGRSSDLTWIRAIRAHFSGLVGNMSPLGMIGGDVVRAGVAMSSSHQPSAIMLTSVVDRIVDTAALMVLGFAGFAWIGGASASAGMVLLAGLVVSLGGVGVLLLANAVIQRTGNVRLAGMRAAFGVLVRQPGLIACALLLSVSIQGSLIGLNAYIGRAVGVDVTFAAWLLAWPAAKVAGYLPIGFGGFGVRETALVALMAPFGGAAGPVLVAGLLWDAVLVVGSLSGWLVLLGVGAHPYSVPRAQKI
jgi:uncharacterized membrane protein YbhN (UPF0104 family)